MAKLIVCAGLAGMEDSVQSILMAGQFLREFELDAFGGAEAKIGWTRDRDEALRFADLAAVVETWKSISRVRPVRPDGKPNRPLTAFHITIEDDEPCPPAAKS